MMGADRRRTLRALLIQGSLCLLVPVALWLIGPAFALSALAGGLVATSASLLFAVLVFARYRADDPGALARRLYLAEAAKLAFVMVAFGVLFATWPRLAPAPLFLTFLMVYLVPWLVVSRRPPPGQA